MKIEGVFVASDGFCAGAYMEGKEAISSALSKPCTGGGFFYPLAGLELSRVLNAHSRERAEMLKGKERVKIDGRTNPIKYHPMDKRRPSLLRKKVAA